MKKSLFSLFFACMIGLSAAEPGGFYGKPLTHIPASPRIAGAPRSAVPLKVFFLIPGTVSSAVNELRLRREFTPVILQTNSYIQYSPWHKGKGKLYALSIEQNDFKKIEADRLKQLKSCDVIVIAKTGLDILPAHVKKAILDQVKKGAGLVYITHDHKKLPKKQLNLTEQIKAGTLYSDSGSLPAVESIWKGQIGKGRVIAFQYKKNASSVHWYFVEPIAPFQSDDPILYDAYHLAVAKALQLTSGKKAPASVKQERTIYSRWGRQVKSTAPGRNLILTRYLDPKGAVADFSVALVNEKAKKGIASIQLKKDIVLPDGMAEAAVNFAAPFTGTLEAHILAPGGRIVSKLTKALKNCRTYKFNIRVPDIPGLEYAPLHVTAKGDLQDEEYAHIYIKRKLKNNDFSITVWANHMPASRLSKFFFRALKEYGVTTVMETEAMWCASKNVMGKPRELKQMQLKPAFYTTRLVGPPLPKKNKFSKPCVLSRWYNYQKNGKLEPHARIQLIAKAGKDLGTVFYNLGDENGLSIHKERDTCHCPECQPRFREYLKRVYKTLDALNKEHGTKYTSWDSIKSVNLEEACDKDLTSLWLDHRLFMEEQFINYHRWAIAQVRAQDPEGVCGIEGLCYPFSSYAGFRLYDMLPHFDFFAPYPAAREIKAMKYLKKNAVTAAWFGSYEGTMNESRMRSTPWGHLFKGLNSTAWWTAGGMSNSGVFSSAKALSADFRALPHFNWAMEEINKIRNSGLGALLTAAKGEKAQIAVHYSNSSLHAATLNPDQSSWDISHRDFGSALSSCGYQYELLSPAELEKGALNRFKVLVLPYSQAISAKEAAAIKDFARKGGLVIADWNPGIMNEHGRVLKQSSLQDLFPKKKRLAIHKYGKGTTVYLADYISEFQARQQKGETDGLTRGLIRLIRNYAGVSPFATITNEFDQIEGYSLFEDGPYTYLCFVGPTAQSKKIKGGAESASETFGESTAAVRKIKLKSRYYVYDMFRGQKSSRPVNEFKIKLAPYTGRVFILTKQAIKPFTVTADKTVLKRGDKLTITVKDPAPVMIAEVPGLCKNTRFHDGKFTLHTAFNDRAGKYQMIITNPITRQKKIVSFNINIKEK